MSIFDYYILACLALGLLTLWHWLFDSKHRKWLQVCFGASAFALLIWGMVLIFTGAGPKIKEWRAECRKKTVAAAQMDSICRALGEPK